MTMIILGTVLGSLTATFVSASRAELDMNRPFQAQEQARLALDKLRREIHCTSEVTPTGPSQSITITLGSYCQTGSGSVTWRACGSGSRWALWRMPDSTCRTTPGAGRVKWADCLTSGNLFNYTAQSSVSLGSLVVELPVDVDTATTAGSYRLTDLIALKNSSRCTAPC